jgi:hypothetical protein
MLIFSFPHLPLFDVTHAKLFGADAITVFSYDGTIFPKTSRKRQREIEAQARERYGEAPAPTFYEVPGIDPEEDPWVFGLEASNGAKARVTVWNGRDDFIHEFPTEKIVRLVGGSKIAVAQVGSPLVGGRSSLKVSDMLAQAGYEGIIHWARDTATYQSVLKEFVGANLPTVLPPDLPADWKPDDLLVIPVKGG